MKLVKYSNARTLLFVSGMFAGGWIWREAHTKISNSNHLVLDEPLCSLGGRVDLISQKIIDAIKGIDTPVVVVGNSLGSLICLDVARQLPDKVEAVIISGAAGFGSVNLNLRMSRRNSFAIAKKVVDLICYDKARISLEATTKTAEVFEKNFGNILRLIRESNASSATDLIPQVQCPIHAIWGDSDVITPFETAKSVFERFAIPCSLIRQCGHSPMYERPQDFAKIVNDCLAK